MESPIDNLVKWYRSLPQDQQVEISTMIIRQSPGFINKEIERSLVSDYFIEVLENSKESIITEIGMSIMIRSSVEFNFIKKRCNKEIWEEKRLDFNRLANKHNSQTFKIQAEQMEFRGRQWLKTCDKWNKIYQITDEYLEQYLLYKD